MTFSYNLHVTRYRRPEYEFTDIMSLTFLTNQDARGVTVPFFNFYKPTVQTERILSSTSD